MLKLFAVPARVERFQAPGSCTVVVSNAPSDLLLVARLTLPPDATHAASVRTLINWTTIETLIEDPGDGPPGSPPHAPFIVEERHEISRVSGDTPLRVLSGTHVDIVMGSEMPPADFIAGSGVLTVEGESWGKADVAIAFVPTNIVDITSSTAIISLERGQEASFEITARVIQGRDVTLSLTMHPQQGVEMLPLTIKAVQGVATTAQAMLRIAADSPLRDATNAVRIVAIGGLQTDGSIGDVNFAWDTLDIGLEVKAPPVAEEPDFEKLRRLIETKYNQIGGFKSRLGLPLVPSMPIRQSADSFETSFRSGFISVKADGTDIFAIAQTFCEISVVGIQCNIRQEAVDEIYGTVSCLIANSANSNSTTVKIPDDGDGVFKMGPVGLRVSGASGLIYSGPVADVLIAVMLIQQDSGDTSEAKKEIAATIAKAAQAGLAAVGGGAAESMFLSPRFIQTISLGVVNAIENMIGLPDDPFNPAYLRLSFAELAQRPHERFILPVDGAVGGEIEYTHAITASGLDGDNDLGKYTVYIDLRTFQQNEKL
ncbi:hypothetical protein ACFOKI_01905 [Sphingomonas qilianensis]|uniref:Uncharacterized protein n=1 Tax=Sphingomonas qilianensis TaxID=1736690 RepID=A0ABU9XS61_9SPHN